MQYKMRKDEKLINQVTKELHSLYRSPKYCIVRVIKYRIFRWTRHIDRMDEGRSAFKMLTIGKRRRWKDNM